MLYPKIINVEPLDNYKIKLYYETGEKKILMYYRICQENGMKNYIIMIISKLLI